MFMREKVIEQKLVKAVRESGGLALKLICPGFNGVPDRLLLFMGGKIAFVEVKAPGEKPRPLQVHRIAQLRDLGFRVYVVDSIDQIDEIISDTKSLRLGVRSARESVHWTDSGVERAEAPDKKVAACGRMRCEDLLERRTK